MVGCGVIGMTTAATLRAAGHEVEIWTRDDPRETTSAAAGAIWYPFLAEPRDAVLRWSAATYRRLQELAEGGVAGVSMRRVVEVFDEADPDLWWASAVPDLAMLGAHEVPRGYRAAARATVPVCDVPVHLEWLLAELDRAGVEVVRRAVRSLDEGFASHDVVVNCAGLGARQLCSDEELRPVRGQAVCVEGAALEDAWIDDTAGRPRYIIPRASSLLLGGTAQEDDERAEPDDADTAQILADASAAWPHLGDARVQEVRVGMRPFRTAVRLERVEREGGCAVVHNYGHGGSGYTVAWGCAEDVASLVAG